MSTLLKSTSSSASGDSRTNRHSSPDYDVAVIGAGPYGLSAAMHLKARGLGVRVFGEPMDFWANTMPQGMLLRSERPASSISDPRSALTLDAYEQAAGIEPEEQLPLRTFVDYGRWFSQHLGSSLDTTMVSRVTREDKLFRLRLSDGQLLTSRHVVVAAGVSVFRKVQAPFSGLPARLLSHCYDGVPVTRFAGKRVAVIGAGQSALESAALLHEAGATTEIIARVARIQWLGTHGWLHRLSLVSHLLYGSHGVGHAGLSRLVGYPNLFSYIPLPLRDKLRKRAIRPGGVAWLLPRVKPIRVTTGRMVRSLRVIGSEVELKLDDGSERRVDHVLLGTGYTVDISRYQFLAPELTGAIQRLDGYPRLTTGFRSSVPGLHFIGAAASRNFGPLLCFVAGTEFTSRQLSACISQSCAPGPVTPVAALYG
jgi:hypothetical protein